VGPAILLSVAISFKIFYLLKLPVCWQWQFDLEFFLIASLSEIA
jgi:hypothetical protein